MYLMTYSPLELFQEVGARYQRYLYTTFYFRDPVLRASFRQALESTKLVAGPFLELNRPYQRGVSAGQLLEELFGEAPDGTFLEAIQGTRPLYRHQEEAIRRVFASRNVVVATGTGSGKTEAFLLPILFHLYREFRRGVLGPGVRALILYPMNALAYDQRDRLGEIARQLKEAGSPFSFTFGQYTGDTPEDEQDARRLARGHGSVDHAPGELIYRSEMRKNPPHILLTNYSMLEYLLIRPQDSPFFSGTGARRWTFLVLDEAHQYRGARGMEMAMLLRRLKERLRDGGKEGPFRCVATSATLLGGEEDRGATARFAATLFAEPFAREDVITARVSQAEEGLADDDPTRVGERLLVRDRRVQRLWQKCSTGPQPVPDLAREIFPEIETEEERIAELGRLVALLTRTANADPDRSTGATPPLFTARYHFLLRSLDGAFISYKGGRRILLERGASPEAPVFEVALCRECGQHYLVGRIAGDARNGLLMEAVRDPGHPDFGATFFRPLETPESEAAGEEEDGAEDTGRVRQRYVLCVHCRSIWLQGRTPPPGAHREALCTHGEVVVLEKQDATREGENQIPRCSACGHHAQDPVREVVHGADGPHTVIATTLYQYLPRDRKKILAFADSRQEAAFFSWYFDRTYNDLLSRCLVWQAGKVLGRESAEGFSLADLVGEYSRLLRVRDLAAPYETEFGLRKEATCAVCREFLTEEKRISLEGVGLGYWSVRWPDWYNFSGMLQKGPWKLSAQEARDVLQILFHLLRDQGAVELRPVGAMTPVAWDDLHLNRPQRRVRLGPPRKEKNVCSWDGGRGGRARLLRKILAARGVAEEEAADAAGIGLREIWEMLLECETRAPDPAYRLLLPAANGTWRVNSAWWRFHAVSAETELWRCETCGRLSRWSATGLCPRPACPGRMVGVRADTLTDNHYRYLYQSMVPEKLRVEEHTAQLERKKAREYQEAFKKGRIHMLSCSTTFELGVDLGDLDTVFLRNVPPEAFNYAQRVGRAGRRPGRPGVAITYCRRAPHDLYHFADPEHVLGGATKPPVLRLTNPKIVLRHMAAVVLGLFFQQYPERFDSVEALGGDLHRPTLVRELRAFLERREREIRPLLRRIVPEEGGLHAALGLLDHKWIDFLTKEPLQLEEPRLLLAEMEVAEDYQKLCVLEQKASKTGDHMTAQWAQDRAKTIAGEDVLSFLSRKAVIPKYGFPVDVVALDTHLSQATEAQDLELQRDLRVAIAEFAPTSALVANKKLWTSGGLKRVAEREWDEWCYRKCPEHKRYDIWKPTQTPPPPCCAAAGGESRFIIPRFGFVTTREKPREPRGRPARMFSTRPFFVGFQVQDGEPHTIAMPEAHPLLTVSRACPGEMGVLCEGRRGRGFWVCGRCGAGFIKDRRDHHTPFGERCTGRLWRVALGHLFVTDVVRICFLSAAQRGVGDVWFAYALAYALAGGAATVLEVLPNDVSAAVIPVPASSDRVLPIILYDNVPGGAGLVARLEEEDTMYACLEAALQRVGGRCGCRPDESCYGCLRNYQNQFAHHELRRGPVRDMLEKIMTAWRSGGAAEVL